MKYVIQYTRKKAVTFVFVLIACTTYYILNTTLVSAQQVKLSITPPLVSIVVKPGKTIIIPYTLTNGSDPVTITSYVVPFLPGGKSGEIFFGKKNSGLITFALENKDRTLNEAFFLKTKGSQKLDLHITIPQNTPDGDYYYSFLSQSKVPGGESDGTNAMLNATIGSNILMTVSDNGRMTVNARIEKFDVLPRYQLRLLGQIVNVVESNDTIPVKLSIQNRGNNLVVSNGVVTLKGTFDTRATFPLPASTILANSSRDIVASDSGSLDKSQDESVLLQGFFVGKYSVSAEVNFGDDSKKLFAQTSFFAFPIRFTLGLLIAVIIVFYIRKYLRALT